MGGYPRPRKNSNSYCGACLGGKLRQNIGVSATKEKLQLLLRRLSGRETTTKHRGIRDQGKTPTPSAAPVWGTKLRQNIGVSATEEKLQLLLRRLSGARNYDKT